MVASAVRQLGEPGFMLQNQLLSLVRVLGSKLSAMGKITHYRPKFIVLFFRTAKLAALDNIDNALKVEDSFELRKYATKAIGILCGKRLKNNIIIEFGHTTPGMTVGCASTTSRKVEVVMSTNDSAYTASAIKFKL